MKNFIIYLISGVVAGVFGGMGMGGGTLLIPLLTVFTDVDQHVAQGVNLLGFIPMAIIALIIHVKNGLVVKKGLVWLILPAAVLGGASGFFAKNVESQILKRIFGGFMILLGIFLVVQYVVEYLKEKKEKN